MDLLFDGHIHAFNAGFVPVYGILRAKGLRHEDAEPARAIIEAALEREKPQSDSLGPAIEGAPRALMDMVDAEARGEASLDAGPDFIGRFVLMMPAEQLRSIAHVLRDTPRELPGRSSTEASAARLAPWLPATDDVGALRVRADSILRNAARLAGPIEADEVAFTAGRGKSAGGIVEWLSC
jgi:hypothetical protein